MLKRILYFLLHAKSFAANATVPETTIIAVRPNDENRAPKRGTQRRRPLVQQIVSEEQVSISEKILIESTSEKDRISMPKVSVFLVIRAAIGQN